MKAAATFLLVLSYLSNCQGWTCKAAPQHPSPVQIDAGQGQVVMRDASFNAFFLSGSSRGSSWHPLGSVQLQHVTVGPAGIWGIGLSNQVYKYVGLDFVPVNGQRLQQVDAGGSVQTVGTSNTEYIYCLNSSSSSNQQTVSANWNNIPGLLQYFSCGPNGCWGANSKNEIFVTKVTPTDCATSGWTHVSGASITAEVGSDGNVFVVNKQGELYQRVGITLSAPQGSDWVHIPMPLPIRSASYDLGRLWVVTTDFILVCTP